MKNILFVTSVFCALAGAGAAQDACTPEAIQSKSGEVAEALQTIKASDPDRARVLSGEIEDLMDAIQGGADIRTVCAFFDEVITEAAG